MKDDYLQIRITTTEKQAIKKEADKRKWTITTLVKEAINEYIK